MLLTPIVNKSGSVPYLVVKYLMKRQSLIVFKRMGCVVSLSTLAIAYKLTQSILLVGGLSVVFLLLGVLLAFGSAVYHTSQAMYP